MAELEPTVRRVQVIHVEGQEALRLMPRYAPYTHAFLLDSGHPNAAVPVLGGTGQTHDWNISAAFVQQSPRPVFLAGGLTAENVASALKTVRPFGLDLCSGIRTAGKLDQGKLMQFIAAVRAAETSA